MSIDTSLLKNWIRENPEKAVSAKIVAAHFGINERTLHTEFLRMERTRIGAFISDVRLEAVKNMLLTTDKRCFEIAHQFTFGREDVLSRWFKRRTGMTMQEFRMKNGKQEPSGGGDLNENNSMCKIANQNCKVKWQSKFPKRICLHFRVESAYFHSASHNKHESRR